MMFLAFFHVVLCVTLSSPLLILLLLLFLASCQVQCEQLHCLESHATLNATQTANAPRERERVSEWLAEHEALGQQLRQLAVPCVASLSRHPLCAVHKVKTKTVNIKRSSQLALSTFHCTVVRWPIRNALDDGRRDRDYSGRGR